jgi:hypothetical protein
MINKKLKVIIVLLMVFAVICVNISYADFKQNEEENVTDFFEVNKTEIALGDTLEMTIDLEKINLNQFEFVLTSNVEIDDVYTKETLEESDIQKESNDVTIELDKEKLDLSKLMLYYKIPEDLKVGTVICLTAQIKAQDKTEALEEESKDANENIDDENKETQNLALTVVYEKQINITVVEKTDTENGEDSDKKDSENKDNKNEAKDDTNLNGKEENNSKNENEANTPDENANKDEQKNQMNQTFETESEKNMQSANQTLSAVSTANTSSGSLNTQAKTTVAQTGVQAETAVYNGSNNNYLASLEIEEVTLSSDFNKEKTTYFANADSLESLTINAVAEDSTAKIAITGTDLKTGTNKVLISVTAENGDVRYYRIYVTKN